PKPGVEGSSPSAPANKLNKKMQNPINFLRLVKQEAFKIIWPSKKETLMGSVTVIFMAIIASLFFLLLDQIFKFGLGFLIG
ncbi:MAG: preprotein translocase subunit SecE, partial [Pelagibacteraceae bacterium]